MRRFKLIPTNTFIPFMGLRRWALALSATLMLLSLVLVGVRGINWGIDFVGGVLIEVETQQPVALADMRAQLEALDIGGISLQEFGGDTLLLIRFSPDPTLENAAQNGIATVRTALAEQVRDFRRVEMVGPSIGDELKIQALEAILIAMALLMAYIWFRFEWQFSVGAILALMHDIAITLGFYALTQMEFNLASIAVLLTVAGYSINDTVVVYDRVREDIRRFKAKTLSDILDFAVNATLSRTVVTSVTTLLALLALSILGGAIIRDFSVALIVGIISGTYSSVFLAAQFLLFSPPKRGVFDDDDGDVDPQ